MGMSEKTDDRAGMRLMFCTWMTLIVAGLAVMIVLPLTGR